MQLENNIPTQKISMKKETLDIKTVCECNRCLGCQTLHPHVSIINLEHPGLEQSSIKFEFYTILLIEKGTDECCCCGRKSYDYAYSTMVFLMPGEIFRMNRINTLPDKGWLLAFHPDLLYRTSLKNNIENYTFFAYRKEEALHLSQRETAKIVCCLENIDEELHHAIDMHSSTILSRHIELLLDYCTRFYERQFITRENINKTLLSRLEKLATQSISSGAFSNGIHPTPEYFAEKLNLSTAYFKDLLKFEKGQTLPEYFRFKQLELAKQMLIETNDSPAVIARRLGFPSVQFFTLVFKKITGVVPSEYKYARN